MRKLTPFAFQIAFADGRTPTRTRRLYLADDAGDWRLLHTLAQRINGQWEETIFVYDASSRLVAEYSTILNETPQVAYLTNDHLGSPRINTNENGAVISRHDYRPYGEEITERTHSQYAADTIRKQFTGYERDAETDLDFAQARMYSNRLGRFTSVDPIFMKEDRLLDPQQMNLYSYVRNNPLVLTDPTGLDFEFKGKDKDKFVDDANNRKDAQFKIKLNDKGIVEVIDKNKVDVSKLSKGEKALFNAINDTDNRAILQGFGQGTSIKLEGGVAGQGGTATFDSTSVEFEAFVGNGTNIVDEGDMALLRKADSTAAGEVIAHTMMESYESAKTGSNDYDTVHSAANSYFPGATVDKLRPQSGNSATVNNYTYNWNWGRINKTFEVTVKMSVPEKRSYFKGEVKAPFGDMTKIRKVSPLREPFFFSLGSIQFSDALFGRSSARNIDIRK